MSNVVVAEYYPPEVVFKIPKGIDLNDKGKVKDWGVKWNILYINLVENNEMLQIESSLDSGEHERKYPQKVTIMDREEYANCLSSDEDEDEDEDEEEDEFVMI